MPVPEDANYADARQEDAPPESRVQKLERLIEEKRGEETEARGKAAKLAAQLKGMPREGGASIDPHKTKTLWGGLALGILKGGLQAVHEERRRIAEQGLRDAEAAEEQSRADRRALEEELGRELRGAGPDETPSPAANEDQDEKGSNMADLTREQHDYLMSACSAAEGKGGDEVVIAEGRIAGPAGVPDGREAEVLHALREEGLLRYEFGTDKAFLTPAGFRYCERQKEGY